MESNTAAEVVMTTFHDMEIIDTQYNIKLFYHVVYGKWQDM